MQGTLSLTWTRGRAHPETSPSTAKNLLSRKPQPQFSQGAAENPFQEKLFSPEMTSEKLLSFMGIFTRTPTSSSLVPLVLAQISEQNLPFPFSLPPLTQVTPAADQIPDSSLKDDAFQPNAQPSLGKMMLGPTSSCPPGPV